MSSAFTFHRPLPHSGLLPLGAVDAIVAGLRADGLAVLPTETGYMLAALATSPVALERAFVAKGRAAAQVMHVACASTAMADSVGVLDPRAARLLAAFTPGPLTVVVEKRPWVPDGQISMAGTVGLRVPEHPATLQVVAAVGAPLTATSLNRSGEPPVEVDEADPTGLAGLDWPPTVAHVVVDPAARRYDRPSTLVRTTGPEVDVLRAGAVAESEIRRALAHATT